MLEAGRRLCVSWASVWTKSLVHRAPARPWRQTADARMNAIRDEADGACCCDRHADEGGPRPIQAQARVSTGRQPGRGGGAGLVPPPGGVGTASARMRSGCLPCRALRPGQELRESALSGFRAKMRGA